MKHSSEVFSPRLNYANLECCNFFFFTHQRKNTCSSDPHVLSSELLFESVAVEALSSRSSLCQVQNHSSYHLTDSGSSVIYKPRVNIKLRFSGRFISQKNLPIKHIPTVRKKKSRMETFKKKSNDGFERYSLYFPDACSLPHWPNSELVELR